MYYCQMTVTQHLSYPVCEEYIKILYITSVNFRYPNVGIGDHNYCRNQNPEASTGTWCFTTDPDELWEYCDIIDCPGSLFI